MIPKDCKRLAEVDFPIAEVSRHAAREKSIRHGHPSTLHLWWARRPLASSRAVLLALLWPDPCDPLCPAVFKAEARRRLREVPACNPGTTDEQLRHALLRFIADFANWDHAAQRTYLEVSRALVKAAHAPDDGGPYEPPLVVDPFAGGGSIPLEALRVGCEAFASDLNPVACLILKVMLEDIPRHGPALAEELRRVGAEIKREAEKELDDLYPKDPDGATPIAYLWARTVRCESPNCGAEIPIFKSPWLSKKGANKARFFKESADGRCQVLKITESPIGGPVQFRIARGEGSEESRSGYEELKATKAKGNTADVICPCCGAVLPGNKKNPRVPQQLAAQRGGADVVFDAKGHRIGGARLLAVVTLRPGETGRHYRLPTERDYEAVRKAQARVAKLLADWERGGKQGLCPVPDEPLPPIGTLGFRVQRYGMLQWGDLFTARQKVAMRTVALAAHDRPQTGDDSTRTTMTMVVGRCADYGSSGVVWAQAGEFVAHTFGRQALPIVWDFAEAVPWTDSSGNLDGAIDWTARVVEAWPGSTSGQVQPADATEHPLPDDTAQVWFTDPPYYDAVPYADLSDYFLVWLKRALPGHPLLRDHFDAANPLTPKPREAVQDETKHVNGRPKDRAWFEETIAKAFAEGRRVLRDDGVGSVVFAHKTTEGWEALLSGMTRGGWTITASWPIATERPGRLRSQDSAALATSVHLICRPRPDDAGVGDWADVLRELPVRVADWMERLQHEGVRGADLVFACIGPALEIFSRYTKVETAEGREVKLDEYLAKVWEVVGRAALAQVLGTAEAKARNGAAGAVEEDARLTALFLWTLQATDGEGTDDAGGEDEDEDAADDDEDEGRSGGKAKGFTLVFDVVRRFAQPLGIELPKWEGRVIETKKGVVRLLPIAERAKQLFGEDGASAVATRLEQTTAPGTNPLQGLLFPEMEAAPKVRGERGRDRRTAVAVSDESLAAAREATTLDRVHAAMLLQAGGRTNALRALLKAEQERGPDFLRLANALSALYPKGSEEKRLLDAMLLAVPR
jgi:adenine-specific DNA methylase